MIFGALFFIIFSFVLNTPVVDLDEIWIYNFSENIANGLVPYKDFNLVTTPLLFSISALFLKLPINGLIVTRVLGSLLLVSVLVMVSLVMKKLIKGKYINIFMLLNISLITIPFINWDYNVAVLLLSLIILNYELKRGNEKLLTPKLKSDFLIGIVAGLAILTKQTTGLILAFVYVMYKWIAIRNKNDFWMAFKISLSRGLGVLVPVIAFLIYLVITNSFMDFIDLCILGVSEFTNVISYSTLLIVNNYGLGILLLAIMIPLVILYTIIYLIKNPMFETLENKNILKLFVFGVANFIVIFPISDDIHFTIGSIILLILAVYIVSTHLVVERESVKKYLNNIITLGTYIFAVVLIVAMCKNYYNYAFDTSKNNGLDHFSGLSMDSSLVAIIKDANEFIDEQNSIGRDVYIIDGNAAICDVPGNRYNKYLDLLLKGNLGKNGVQKVIDKIDGLNDNSWFLIYKYGWNWQMPMEVVDYIRGNYDLIGETIGYYVYGVTE